MASSPCLKLLYSTPPRSSFVNGRVDESFIGIPTEPVGLAKRIVFGVGLEFLDDDIRDMIDNPSSVKSAHLAESPDLVIRGTKD